MSESDYFKSVLERAGEVVECSWSVGIIEKKDGGDAKAVAVFHDSTDNKFAHAFSFKAMA